MFIFKPFSICNFFFHSHSHHEDELTLQSSIFFNYFRNSFNFFFQLHLTFNFFLITAMLFKLFFLFRLHFFFLFELNRLLFSYLKKKQSIWHMNYFYIFFCNREFYFSNVLSLSICVCCMDFFYCIMWIKDFIYFFKNLVLKSVWSYDQLWLSETNLSLWNIVFFQCVGWLRDVWQIFFFEFKAFLMS